MAALVYATRRAVGDTATQAWQVVAESITPRRSVGTWRNAAGPYVRGERARVAELVDTFGALLAEAAAFDTAALAGRSRAHEVALRARSDARLAAVRAFDALLRAPTPERIAAARAACAAWRAEIVALTASIAKNYLVKP